MKVHLRGINQDYLYFVEEAPINPAEGLPSKGHKIIFDGRKYLVIDVVWFIDKNSIILEVKEI
jgi:hypothetical protein